MEYGELARVDFAECVGLKRLDLAEYGGFLRLAEAKGIGDVILQVTESLVLSKFKVSK